MRRQQLRLLLRRLRRLRLRVLRLRELRHLFGLRRGLRRLQRVRRRLLGVRRLLQRMRQLRTVSHWAISTPGKRVKSPGADAVPAYTELLECRRRRRTGRRALLTPQPREH